MPSKGTDSDADLAFHGQLRDRGAYPLVAVAALVVVAIVGINFLPTSDDVRDRSAAVTPSSSSSPSPTATPSPRPASSSTPIELSPLSIPWRDMEIHLTAPTTWEWSGRESALCRTDCLDSNRPSMAIHAVTGVVSDACRFVDESALSFEDVGPTVGDMTAALVNLAGPTRSGPTDVMLGAYLARRFVLTFSDEFSAACGGPEGRWLWENDDGSYFGLLMGGTATIYVVDVDGERLVVTSHYRGASAEEIASLHAIIASIDIELVAGPIPSPRCASRRLPTRPRPYLTVGRHSLTVECVEVSFDVPTSGWEVFNGSYITKSTVGPQGAEAIIFWTAFPNSGWADPCVDLSDAPARPSAADLAAALSGAPGTELVSGPSNVTIGEHPATSVVLSVRTDLGCDPGFFYAWDAVLGGAFWMDTRPGDTIRVWVVDVDGAVLVIEAETKPAASPFVDEEIQEIIDSIRIE